MSAIQVTMPLQIICQLLAATQVVQNVTLPSIRNSSSTETTEAPILPFGYVAFPEYGVAYKYFDVGLPHSKARKMCLNENGQLAVIDSREKLDKILNHFSIWYDAWIGVGKSHDDKEWTTIDGKSTNNLPWANGEPNGPGRCAYLRNSNGLVSYSCDYADHHYLCEIPLPRN